MLIDAVRWIANRTGTKSTLLDVRDRVVHTTDPIPAIRRRRARRAAESLLNVIIDPAECVDRFDASYIDDLPHILKENHQITDQNGPNMFLYKQLKSIWNYWYQHERPMRIADLPRFFTETLGGDAERFMPNRVQGRTARQYNLHLVSSFKNVEGRRAGVDIDLDQVRRYQIEISLISGGEKQQDPDHFPNRRTSLGGEPWSAFIRGLLASGVLSPDSDVLDVGPRYLSEIRYFRDDLGLPRTIGLDLYTKDESLIKVGDMHAMPFADNSFDMLFTRATHDKAYDIRKALAEHVRVVRPGGVIISEDGMSYIVGVSELARTDLKSTAVLLRMYGPTAGEILYQKDLASTNLFCRRYGFLAIRVRKS